MEIGNHGVLELTVISRHDDIIIGRMGSYDFDALKSDLDKYNEKCPIVGISEDSRYVFKSKDSDKNIVLLLPLIVTYHYRYLMILIKI